jgi:hypothetical protein
VFIQPNQNGLQLLTSNSGSDHDAVDHRERRVQGIECLWQALPIREVEGQLVGQL